MKAMIVRGRPVCDEASKVCLLFDPKTGHVVHVHGVTILDGGRHIEAAEVEARARKHAERFGKAATDLKALHVPIEAIRGKALLRVNPSGDGLLPSSPPPGRRLVWERLRQRRAAPPEGASR